MELLTDVPRTVDEIENLMAKGREEELNQQEIERN